MQDSRGVLLHSEPIFKDHALHDLRQVMRGSQPMPSLRGRGAREEQEFRPGSRTWGFFFGHEKLQQDDQECCNGYGYLFPGKHGNAWLFIGKVDSKASFV
jgi:hypothetical protein